MRAETHGHSVATTWKTGSTGLGTGASVSFLSEFVQLCDRPSKVGTTGPLIASLPFAQAPSDGRPAPVSQSAHTLRCSRCLPRGASQGSICTGGICRSRSEPILPLQFQRFASPLLIVAQIIDLTENKNGKRVDGSDEEQQRVIGTELVK